VAGIQNATTFVAAQGEMTWHGPDNPEDDGATLRCEWGDGNSDTHSMAFGGAGIAICQHVFGSTGTFRIRVTITDQWDRGASAEGTAQVATVTGQWTSSASAGVYALSQTGSGVAGTFSPPTGASAAVSGSVSARASTPFGFPDPGRVTLTLPTLVGSTVVLATFTASPTFNGAVLDVNRLVGALVGPGVNNPNVTLTRQ
jgi:hypothetical protein